MNEYDYFDPGQTFDCGQCFRFARDERGGWSGVTGDVFFRVVTQADGTLFIECTSEQALTERVLPFLALNEDYGAIRADLKRRFPKDEYFHAAMRHGRGIRILRQDPWEALCSFILSQNNNIPRIRGIIETLCERYGKPIENGRYAFPAPPALYAAGTQALYDCRMGYRAKYLSDAAEKVCTGALDLAKVARLPADKASAALQQIKGVGEKVAACTLLFGFGMICAFPMDVWMRRILHDQYGDALDPASLGPYAGIAQQYLFYYARQISRLQNGRNTAADGKRDVRS